MDDIQTQFTFQICTRVSAGHIRPGHLKDVCDLSRGGELNLLDEELHNLNSRKNLGRVRSVSEDLLNKLSHIPWFWHLALH